MAADIHTIAIIMTIWSFALFNGCVVAASYAAFNAVRRRLELRRVWARLEREVS